MLKDKEEIYKLYKKTKKNNSKINTGSEKLKTIQNKHVCEEIWSFKAQTFKEIPYKVILSF